MTNALELAPAPVVFNPLSSSSNFGNPSQVAGILQGKDMLPAVTFAAFIGCGRTALKGKLDRHEVLGLEDADGLRRFPDWQVGKDGNPFAVLPDLFERLGGEPWTVYRFLVAHHPDLNGMSGRQALYRGRTKSVLSAAEGFLDGLKENFNRNP